MHDGCDHLDRVFFQLLCNANIAHIIRYLRKETMYSVIALRIQANILCSKSVVIRQKQTLIRLACQASVEPPDQSFISSAITTNKDV